VARERLTVRYKGNPEGVNILIGLLRRQGLKVRHSLSLNLPLAGQHWALRRDIVQVYGTVLEVSGRSGASLSAELAVMEFADRFPEAAKIELGGPLER
jgi:hypothetical protein